MNGSLLAALVVVALVVVVLALKNRASQKKAKEGGAAVPPASPVPPLQEPQPETAEEPLVVAAEPEVGASAPEIEIAPAVDEIEIIAEPTPPIEPELEPEPAPLPEIIAAEELESAAISPEPAPPVGEEPLELVELEIADVDLPIHEALSPVEEILTDAEQAESGLVELDLEPEAEHPAQPEPLPIADEQPAEIVPAAEVEPVAVLETEPEPEQAPEQEALPAHPPEPEHAAPLESLIDAADLPAEPTPAEADLRLVRFTLEDYSTRLNQLEERQRAALAQAVARRDDKQRDQLQRELVLMNDRLALLADSYVEEMACYQQVSDALAQVRAEIGGAETNAALEQLQHGDPHAAEQLLAGLSQQARPFAAQAAYLSGQLAECRVDLQRAMALYRTAVEREPENPLYLRAAGRTARCLYNYKEALPWLESFVRISRSAQTPEPLALALAQRELAYTYVLSGQYQKAGPLYKESMTVLAQRLGQDHPEMATSWRQIGELQETMGEYDKAVSLYQKALHILEKKRGADHPALAGILDKLAALCMELEMEKQAAPLYERLVRIREKALRPTHPQLAISLNNLAESYRLQGQYAEAEGCYRKSLAINEALHGSDHPSVAAILQELAKLCVNQRKPEEAKQYQERAAAIFQQSVEASERKSGAEALTLEL
jgi:tetratricopeptide (TPR) repeat protein